MATYIHYIHHQAISPYMDEIFHIPQAQQYCYSYTFLPKSESWSSQHEQYTQKHDFTYDDKITTFPGLYWMSWLWRETLHFISWVSSDVFAVLYTLFNAMLSLLGLGSVQYIAGDVTGSQNDLLRYCHHGDLRVLNVLLGIVLFVVCVQCRDNVLSFLRPSRHSSHDPNDTKNDNNFYHMDTCLVAFLVCSWPTTHFYVYVYYTDTASTLMVMLAYNR